MAKPLQTHHPSLAIPTLLAAFFKSCPNHPLLFSSSSSCLETGSDSPNVRNNWILNSNSSVKYSVIKLA